MPSQRVAKLYPAAETSRVQKATHHGATDLKRKRTAKFVEDESLSRDVQSLAKSETGPFPGCSRPSEDECRAARESLALLHGEPEGPAVAGSDPGKAQPTVLDSLVRTILSQNTTDTTSHRAFANLTSKFADWEAVRTGDPGKSPHKGLWLVACKVMWKQPSKLEGLLPPRLLEYRHVTALAHGSLLAPIQTQTFKQEILNRVKEEQGECSLEHLGSKTDGEIKKELLQYPGVGPKTAACVLMFCLGRYEFPVDTHVWRIAKSLGWVPAKANREQTYEHLNERIPDDIKYALHVLMVEHGKRCPRCAKNKRPRKEPHGPCPLSNLAAAAEQCQRLSPQRAAEDADKALGVKEEPEEEGPRGVMAEEEKSVKIEAKTEEVEQAPAGQPGAEEKDAPLLRRNAQRRTRQ